MMKCFLSARIYELLVYRIDFSLNRIVCVEWAKCGKTHSLQQYLKRAKEPNKWREQCVFVCTQWSDMAQKHTRARTLRVHSNKNKQTPNEVTIDSCVSTSSATTIGSVEKTQSSTRAHYKSKLTASGALSLSILFTLLPALLFYRTLRKLLEQARTIHTDWYIHFTRLHYYIGSAAYRFWMEHDSNWIFNFACSTGMAKLLRSNGNSKRNCE